MDLPRMTSELAIGRYREEIQNLVDRVSSHFKVSLSTTALRSGFRASNRTHGLLRQLKDLVSQGRLSLPGHELMELLRAGGVLPRRTYNGFVKRVIDECVRPSQQEGVPVLLTGSMLENPEIVSMIEACGGHVVAYDLCVTGRQPENPIPLDGESIMALARHYLLKPPCARMQEIQRRIDHLLGIVRTLGVQGVIYYVQKFCDTFLYEAPVLRQRLKELGTPMLIIESEYRSGRGGGAQTRIQAFLEMLSASANTRSIANASGC
jgi:benzoyl-CoA reductase/2-hydroxyglutaryl-CoA dehydratase subunit BcrC/BadD/HgdB